MEGAAAGCAGQAARFIIEHAAQRITLEDVADHVGYSPFHLARSFQRQVGVPPGRFLSTHRFQQAKRLLLAGDDKIIDVCHAVGFDSVGTFTTRFTAAVGVSPSGFRSLPGELHDAPPRPVAVPGADPAGGLVGGTVRLTEAAAVALAGRPAVYVGLFTGRAACGRPAAGALLAEVGPFLITGVPPGRYWVLASALPAAGDPRAQLVPASPVAGAHHGPILVRAGRGVDGCRVELDVVDYRVPPVVVALPVLAWQGAQDRRRKPPSRLAVSSA